MPTEDAVVVAPPLFHGRSTFRVGVPLPPALTGTEVGAVLGYSVTRSSQLKNAGAFDLFELLPRIGISPRYSGKKLQQWLDGDLPQGQARFFGARRPR